MTDSKIDILDLLRSKTKPFHSRMDSLPVLTALLKEELTVSDYVYVLKKFYGFFLPLEGCLRNALDWRALGFNLEARSKIHFLIQDLTFQKIDIGTIELCPALTDVSSQARALGCLYVLEGSTLGGQLIAPRIVRSQRLVGDGARFFSSYGPSGVKSSWIEVQTLLRHELQDSEVKASSAVSAACDTFSYLETWLSTPLSKVRHEKWN